MNGGIYLEFAMFAVLIALSGFFASSETAIFSISYTKARSLLKRNVKGAEALFKLKNDPESMIITILIGNNIVNVAASAVATSVAINYFGSIGIGFAIGIVTFILLLFGDIFPKNYAVRNSEKLSLMAADKIFFLRNLIYPLVLLFKLLIKPLKIVGGPRKGMFSEDELKTMVDVGVEEGKLLGYEKDFIKGVLKFNDLTASDVLTPREDLFCLDQNMKVGKAVKEVNKNRFSRIPVIGKDKDHVVGIVLLRDLLNAYTKSKNMRIKEIAKRPIFIEKDMPLYDIFNILRKKSVHIAIVRDEYAGTEGIVTIDDLMQEIIGEITTEADVSPEFIKRISKTKILVHGETRIDVVNDFFNTNISEMNQRMTVADFFAKKYKGSIKAGSSIIDDHIKLAVKEASKEKPVKVWIQKIQ